MNNMKKKYRYLQGGVLDSSYMKDRNKTNQQVSTGIGVVGAINPIIGAGLALGQEVGKASTDEYGIYKSKAGEFFTNSFDPTTGIQNLKDLDVRDPDQVLNQLTLGLLGTSASQEKAKAAKLEHQKRLATEQHGRFLNESRQMLQSYPSQGMQMSGYYAKYGGKIPSFLTNALAEGGEVIMSDTPPMTDENGGVSPLASDVSKFKGDSHEAQSGGIGFKPTSEGMIFSDALRTSEGLTYAKSAELIGKQKGKFEKKLEASTDYASHNTAKRMIEKLDKKLYNLFNEQETLKQNGQV